MSGVAKGHRTEMRPKPIAFRASRTRFFWHLGISKIPPTLSSVAGVVASTEPVEVQENETKE